MNLPLLKIQGGTVYDPTNGIEGQQQDLYIAGDRIVACPEDADTCSRTLDVTGCVVMPGGIDMHSHIAGSKVNAGRRLMLDSSRDAPMRRTDSLRSGSAGTIPSTFATGYKYAALGYTTAFDAAIAPLQARQAAQELEDTPCIDSGYFLLAGNNEFVLRAIARQDDAAVSAYLGWLVHATKGYAIKLVNPGGIAAWRTNIAHGVCGLDDRLPTGNVTARDIIRHIARSADHLDLPHPAHIHCNHLGMPGNWRTTLETMRALEGSRGHLPHIQFHSYGGGGESDDAICSAVQPLAEFINTHDHVTVDVGQVMFGKTISMTADSPTAHYLANLYGSPLYSCDIECESGCGVAPIEYRNKARVNSWQWAIGLEWFLSIDDPWKIAMSTDHPNGGSFLSYPQIIRLLMDRNLRNEALDQIHPDVRRQSPLAQLDREYTLAEIAIITRAAPARMLGLKSKGHLGPGADADLAIYSPHENHEVMFALPRIVIKAGQIVAEEGQIRAHTPGKRLAVQVDYDQDYTPAIQEWITSRYSIEFDNYPCRNPLG